MSEVRDILVRRKTLAVQAGSGQLSNTERSMLNTEYTSLLEEVERISLDTEFNGNQLINGSVDIASNANFGPAAGVINFSVSGLEAGTGTTWSKPTDRPSTRNAPAGTFPLQCTNPDSALATPYRAPTTSTPWTP